MRSEGLLAKECLIRGAEVPESKDVALWSKRQVVLRNVRQCHELNVLLTLEMSLGELQVVWKSTMVGLIGHLIVVLNGLAHEELDVLTTEQGVYTKPSCCNIAPEEVIDDILCVVGIDLLRQIIEVLQLRCHGTGCNLYIFEGTETIEPLSSLGGVGRIVLCVPHMQRHVLTEFLHDIGADALHPVDVLQGLALGNVATPQCLYDTVRIDRLDAVTEEGLQCALHNGNGTITHLILVVRANLEIALHLMHMLLIADAGTSGHVLQGSLHDQHRHDNQLSAVLLETL